MESINSLSDLYAYIKQHVSDVLLCCEIELDEAEQLLTEIDKDAGTPEIKNLIICPTTFDEQPGTDLFGIFKVSFGSTETPTDITNQYSYELVEEKDGQLYQVTHIHPSLLTTAPLRISGQLNASGDVIDEQVPAEQVYKAWYTYAYTSQD